MKISCNTPVHSKEEAEYLLDEKQDGVSSQFGISKWNAESSGQITLKIDVIGEPIRISHYALKSANDYPNRDPKAWKLFGVDVNHREHVIHDMPDNLW